MAHRRSSETRSACAHRGLKVRDDYVREAAARVLGDIGPEAEAAVPILQEQLKVRDYHGKVQSATANALAKIGAAAVPALIEVLKDKDASARLAAASALGKLGPAAKDAAPVLTQALKENNLPAHVVAQVLRKIGQPAATEALKGSDAATRALAAAALGKPGPDDIAPLIGLLRHNEEEVRKQALDGLSLGGSAAVGPLIETLKDKEVIVRRQAVSALSRIGPEAEDAVPVLIERLRKDDDPWLRGMAANALVLADARGVDRRATSATSRNWWWPRSYSP
jgi:HEAT repeat protein